MSGGEYGASSHRFVFHSPFGPFITTLLGLAMIAAACLGLVALADWVTNNDSDHDRRVTINNVLAANGFNADVPHTLVGISKIDGGSSIKLTLNAGNAGRSSFSVTVIADKISYRLTNGIETARFIYNEDALFWDNLGDRVLDWRSPATDSKAGVVKSSSRISLGELVGGHIRYGDDGVLLHNVVVNLRWNLYQIYAGH